MSPPEERLLRGMGAALLSAPTPSTCQAGFPGEDPALGRVRRNNPPASVPGVSFLRSAVIYPLHRSTGIAGILTTAVLTLAASPPGQDSGFSADRFRIGAGQPPAVALRMADMDADGLPDLIRLSEKSLTVFVQDHAGRFSPRNTGVTPADGTFFRDVALGDLQPGGGPDLAVLSANGAVDVVGDQGGGILGPVQPPPVSPLFAAPACQLLVADLDGVAGDDVLVLLDGGPLLFFLFLADGNGGFVDVTLTHAPDNVGLSTPGPHAALGDFDGDGDPDVIVVSSSTAPVLLDNDLNGAEGRGVLSISPGRFPDTAPLASRVLAVDVLGDALPDVIFGLAGPAERSPALYPNSGGGFANAAVLSGFATKGVRELLAGDADGDQIADLIALQDDGAVLMGKGSAGGGFGGAVALLPPASRTALAIGDLENDGDLDLCTGGSRLEDQVLLGRGNGQFLDTEAVDFPIGMAPADHLGALVDVDRNGDPDVVIYSRSGEPQWFRNDGSARFVPGDASTLPVLPPATGYRSLVAASVSRAGGHDLLVAGNPGAVRPLRVLVGTVGGYVEQTGVRFPVVGIPDVAALAHGPVCTQNVATAPLDDLVIADSSGGLYLARNSGGVYSLVPGAFLGPPVAGPGRILLGDIDRDGNCDVVVLQTGGPTRFFMGSRFELFFEPVNAPITPAARDGELGDVNGDGILDLVLVRPDPLTGLIVLTGDGTGSFADVTSSLLPFQPQGRITDVALLYGDPGTANPWVGDSRARLLVAVDGAPDQLLRWDGAAYGAPIALPFRGSMQTTALLTADVDREGDTDVVTLRRGTWPGLLRNTDMHFSTTTAAQIGRVLGLRFVAPVPGSYVFVFLGPTQPAVPTPFGLLRLNFPALLVQAPIVGGRELSVDWPLPATLAPGRPPLQVAFVDDVLNIRVSNLEFVVLTNH